MNKEIITNADIETLKAESSKLKPGTTVIATLGTEIKKNKSGEVQVVKSFNIESQKREPNILGFPGTAPLAGEGIKGQANLDTIRKVKRETGKKAPFSLKKSFFSLLDKAETAINDYLLNRGRIIYNYDEFGRVYFTVNNKRYYLNKNKTAVLSEDGEYATIVINDDETIDFEFDPDAITEAFYFNYLYISRQSEEESEKIRDEEEDAMLKAYMEANQHDIYFGKNNDSKVVDIEEYRRRMEEGPRR